MLATCQVLWYVSTQQLNTAYILPQSAWQGSFLVTTTVLSNFILILASFFRRLNKPNLTTEEEFRWVVSGVYILYNYIGYPHSFLLLTVPFSDILIIGNILFFIDRFGGWDEEVQGLTGDLWQYLFSNVIYFCFSSPVFAGIFILRNNMTFGWTFK